MSHCSQCVCVCVVGEVGGGLTKRLKCLWVLGGVGGLCVCVCGGGLCDGRRGRAVVGTLERSTCKVSLRSFTPATSVIHPKY